MEQTSDIRILNEKIEKESSFVDMIRMEMNKVIVGQRHLTDSLMIGLLANGHILLEGVPGLAKTLAIKSLAAVIDAKFSRIQFTPDLLPADLIGTMIYSQKKEEFIVKKGPVFANFILADEINRSPAKVQSALLEAMQERQVTIGESTFKLDEPFLVLATQNPIEQEGTYPLPEAQLDRFMFNIWLDYPSHAEEVEIVKATTADYEPQLETIVSAEDIIYFQNLIRRTPVNDNVVKYAVSLARSTRPNLSFSHPMASQYLNWGAGPRASQNMIIGAKAHALLNGKYSPDIEDVQQVAVAVLRHRIVKNYKAEAENISIPELVGSFIKELKM